MSFVVQKLSFAKDTLYRLFSTTTWNNMRLVQFRKDYKQSIGVELSEDTVVNLTGANARIPNNIVELLKGGNELLSLAKSLSENKENILSKSEIILLPPVTGCEKVICVGLNYKDHCTEQDIPIPKEPVIFSKFPSCIVGDGDEIVLPKISDSVDWEVELAVVIGKEGKHIKANEALDYVAGYTVANDVSARDWQMKKNAKQWLLGKTFDTFLPLGPALVTKDSLPDPSNLSLSCTVNGSVVQDSNTSQLVFTVEECIAWISQFCTIKPGDVLLTGTPPGVGVFRKPPVYLKDGDVVSCEIEKVGKITNKVVAE